MFKNDYFSVKYSAKRIERQITDSKKMFANHIYKKGLVSRVSKGLLKLNNKKIQSENGKRQEETIHPKCYTSKK